MKDLLDTEIHLRQQYVIMFQLNNDNAHQHWLQALRNQRYHYERLPHGIYTTDQLPCYTQNEINQWLQQEQFNIEYRVLGQNNYNWHDNIQYHKEFNKIAIFQDFYENHLARLAISTSTIIEALDLPYQY